MSSLEEQIAEMEQRVLNAATLEGAKRYHEQLDRLREKQHALTETEKRRLRGLLRGQP